MGAFRQWQGPTDAGRGPEGQLLAGHPAVGARNPCCMAACSCLAPPTGTLHAPAMSCTPQHSRRGLLVSHPHLLCAVAVGATHAQQERWAADCRQAGRGVVGHSRWHGECGWPAHGPTGSQQRCCRCRSVCHPEPHQLTWRDISWVCAPAPPLRLPHLLLSRGAADHAGFAL